LLLRVTDKDIIANTVSTLLEILRGLELEFWCS
jgi:hypothetical protein